MSFSEASVVRYYESIKEQVMSLGFDFDVSYEEFFIKKGQRVVATCRTVGEIDAFCRGYIAKGTIDDD